MKRSEVIKTIEGLIELAASDRNAFTHPEGYAYHAENLLSTLEQLGMLPPQIKIDTPMGPQIFLTVNEWEETANYDEYGMKPEDYESDPQNGQDWFDNFPVPEDGSDK